jgi:solute:Na+ symporter, SSS family
LSNIVPIGIKGLAFSAIAAAAVSALSSIVNSVSTVFTMDIYKAHFKKDTEDKKLVVVGRVVALIALIIATCIAPQLRTLDQAYQYIQEYTGYIYPGEFLIFFCGLFWRRSSATAAVWVALLTIPLGIIFKIISPGLPFILRIGYVFIILTFVMIGLSLMTDKNHLIDNKLSDEKSRKKALRMGWRILGAALTVGLIVAFLVVPLKNLAIEAIYVLVAGFSLIGLIIILNNTLPKMNDKGLIIERGLFNTTTRFNIAAIGICGILAVLYTCFW